LRDRGIKIASGRVETAGRAMRLSAQQQVASRGGDQAAKTIRERKSFIRRPGAESFRGFSGKRAHDPRDARAPRG
jgi:hypothetical protein